MTTNNLKKGLLALSLGLFFFSSCKKDKSPAFEQLKGIYVLNEGRVDYENASISYYNLETKEVTPDYFKSVNGRALGETANDLKQYGSKIYCVVSGVQGKKKSFVEVLDAATGRSIKTISFNGDTEGYLPRYIAFDKGKAYVSRYDGKISRIDTASLSIDANLQLMNGGDIAEGIEELTVANGKLYVTGSDHFLFPQRSLSDKVVVIDLPTFKVIKEIPVNLNPTRITTLDNGDLLVTCSGNYWDIPAKLDRLSSATDKVTASYDLDATVVATKGQSYAMVTGTDWTINLYTFNTSTGSLGTPFITDATPITSLYGANVNSLDQSVALTDAIDYKNNGQVYVFDKFGKKQYAFEAGVNPKIALFQYIKK
ncbi:hypothetical protein Pedsa_1458 [Pseudopedobacter saltans DSM 12145]|uniref:Lipoprotein n=1 Tax=Pseudopedobacter saltans (strain ATCC 51119 / DSM 12145 / JCM 21818 / CCUG 39354 / LMG 10337 / NBRC 100064 / NCIMB 13643) TaxID=762903 RepID=F0S575_PSESL|nr:DUF5074 domain-containing protein [Pseudopedobacter saltans]ADY52020.1 hypothetical protein Pedsa_1458 [Pseudopedobacter saltans DSM 12145]